MRAEGTLLLLLDVVPTEMAGILRTGYGAYMASVSWEALIRSLGATDLEVARAKRTLDPAAPRR